MLYMYCVCGLDRLDMKTFVNFFRYETIDLMTASVSSLSCDIYDMTYCLSVSEWYLYLLVVS